jgi:hypothetical protein
MKLKHVYLVDNAATAKAAVTAARGAGIDAVDISLLARPDVGLEGLAADAPAAGSDTSADAGLPDPVRRRFEDEIAIGRILVVLEGHPPELTAAAVAMADTGAALLPFEEPSLG